MFTWTLFGVAFWKNPPTHVSKCSYKVAAQKTPGLLSSDLNEQRGPRTLPKTLYIQLQPAACPVISRLDGATVAQSSEA